MSGSRLIGLMRQQAINNLPRGIELATVVSPPPELKIRIDNMKVILEAEDLIVCEHLLEHTVTCSTSPAVAASSMSQAGEGPHAHKLYALTIEAQELKIQNRLKVGDRIVVMALPGEQQYLVWDKAVIMS